MLLQVETVSIGLLATGAALAVIALAFSLASAVHAFVTIRRRSDFARPRWYWSAWVAVPLALIASAGLAEVRSAMAAWRAFDAGTGSMVPTLRVGDFLIAETKPYLSRPPERGDVVVFLNPRADLPWIKRVIGLPGNRVQMRAGHLYLNGAEVPRQPMGTFAAEDAGVNRPLQRFRFTLPGGRQFDAVKISDRGLLDDTAEFYVSDDHLFVLGDNLNNSADSRLPEAVGFVPINGLIGRVGIIYWSRDLGRIGTRIR